MSTDQKIALVELHDARFASLTLAAGGLCRLCLQGVTVYREVGKELFQLSKCDAELNLAGVSRFSWEGRPTPDGRITGDSVSDLAGEIEWLHLLTGKAISALSLSFDSGSRLNVASDSAELKIGRVTGTLPDWVGPL